MASMHNLAFTLQSQARYKEALALMERCFQLREQVLGVEHPDTQLSLNILSSWRAEYEEIHRRQVHYITLICVS
jgi:hypothetical protein